MTSAAQKFTFDTEFDLQGRVTREPLRVKKRFTPEEVEAARADARAQGERSALVQAEENTAAIVQEALKAVRAIQTRLDADSSALRAEAADLALAAARVVADEALNRFPEDVILGFFQEIAQRLRAAPMLRVSLAQDVDTAQQRLREAAEAAGLAEALEVLHDPELKPGDVRIVWREGAGERTAEAAWTEIRAAAERWLALEAPEAPQQLSLFDHQEPEASHGR